jgi:VIT1/CCC1 family predicted Fe2+/Mn2+ transporter
VEESIFISTVMSVRHRIVVMGGGGDGEIRDGCSHADGSYESLRLDFVVDEEEFATIILSLDEVTLGVSFITKEVTMSLI